jgi:ubiquinone/menaquinone biosynthesis C-methylase UbiE
MTGLDGFWRVIGHQFSCPSGLGGRLMGSVMELVNEAPNRVAIASLEIEPSDVVVELGFGPGRAIETLVAKTPLGRVYGVDPSEEMLASASHRNKQAIACGRAQLRQGKIDALRLPSGSIDKILAVNVVYFFDQFGGELREARRLLKPGGKIAIYATDKSTMAHWKFASPETHRLFGRDDLARLFSRGGFDIDEFSIREVPMAFGIMGLVASASKRPR